MTNQIEPTLTQIVIYPVKSLDGVTVSSAKISEGGALVGDRRWAIVDEHGKVVNGKRTAKIQQLRSQIDLDRELISLQTSEQNITDTFSLTTELIPLAEWLTQFFGFPVTLVENAVNGFPDDLKAFGPTIISTATLEMICTWFPDLDLNEVRRRFRTNIELKDVPAFWEDRLFTSSGAVTNFQLGNVQFHGINPCQRCIVPTRNSLTAATTANFQKTFNQQRQQTFPDWANLSRFNHFYRLAINTQIPSAEAGKLLRIGDQYTDC
jgi:uncharacterized protein YcbX